MAVNPDPKPGRWILPLVILAMIAFTYFFIRELPEASPDTTLLSQPTTTASVPATTGTTVDGGGGSDLDPATQAYLDGLDGVNAELQLLRTEVIAVNDGFDADPRQVEYRDAEARFDVVVSGTAALEAQVVEMTVPSGLEINHEALQTQIRFATLAAGDALSGLRSTDPGDLRRAAVEAYARAADDFDTEVTNAHNAAGDTQN